MKTAARKAKGRRFQQWVRDLILKTFPNLTEDDVRSTGMGQGGVDIQLSSVALKMLPWAIECKNDEKVSVWAAWKQAKANSKNKEPVVFMTKNYHDNIAVVRAEYLLELITYQNWNRTGE